MASANQRQVAGDHYKKAKYQHWDFAADNRLGYFEGQITKYVTRWREKNGIQDLEKALHFADKLYELLGSASYTAPPKRQMYNFNEFATVYALGKTEARIVTICSLYTEPHHFLEVRSLLKDLIADEKEQLKREWGGVGNRGSSIEV